MPRGFALNHEFPWSSLNRKLEFKVVYKLLLEGTVLAYIEFTQKVLIKKSAKTASIINTAPFFTNPLPTQSLEVLVRSQLIYLFP
jgi:hypothetical protein